MAIAIKIPSVGESVSEVTIGKWLKAEGDAVEKDEIILALETDKVNVEVTSPEAGILRGIKHKEGDTAKIGEEVASIEPGENLSGNKTSKHAATKADSAPKPDAKAEDKSASKPADKPAATGGADKSDGAVMPAAARAMATDNVSRDSVEATGPGGRVLKEDVARAGKQAAAPAPAGQPNTSAQPADGSLTQTVPMSPLRRKVAERLLSAQANAAILTTFNEVDMTAVMALRKTHQDSFVKRYGTKLGFMSFFVKAVIDGLRAFPEINASIDGNNMVYKRFYDIGVAVSSDKGLVVPVVRRAELMSFAEIEQSITDYGMRAKSGKLKLEEMTGGTFTITNGGVFGSLMSTPILNPPQSGILGMHSIVERPIGINGQVVLRPMMYIALSYDHRIVDGRGAVSFLKRVKDCIESPERMLLEI